MTQNYEHQDFHYQNSKTLKKEQQQQQQHVLWASRQKENVTYEGKNTGLWD